MSHLELNKPENWCKTTRSLNHPSCICCDNLQLLEGVTSGILSWSESGNVYVNTCPGHAAVGVIGSPRAQVRSL